MAARLSPPMLIIYLKVGDARHRVRARVT